MAGAPGRNVQLLSTQTEPEEMSLRHQEEDLGSNHAASSSGSDGCNDITYLPFVQVLTAHKNADIYFLAFDPYGNPVTEPV